MSYGEQFPNQHEGEEPNIVSEYLREKGAALANDYSTPDGKHAESCGLIAAEVARMLLAQGRQPEIVSVRGKPVDSRAIIANEPLQPVRYSGRVQWGGHVVCVCDGKVYDPMIERPIAIDEYPKEAFGVDVDMRTTVSAETMEEYLRH